MTDQNEKNINIQSKQIPSTAVEAFNGFLENFVQGKSYVLSTDKQSFFTDDNLTQTYTEYCERSKEKDSNKDKSFNEVIIAIKDKNDVKRETMIDIINHALWLWALPNNRKTNWVSLDGDGNKKGKKNSKEANNTTDKDTSNNSNKYNDELLKIEGVAGGGSGYVQTKTNGVRFILYLFTQIIDKEDSAKIKNELIETCKVPKDAMYDNYKVPDGVKNLLLHLCNPVKYEPIASTVDKEKIVKSFGCFINDWEKTDEENEYLKRAPNEDPDNSLFAVRYWLKNKQNMPEGFSFYSSSLALMWKGESVTDLSLSQKLEYKKAMILYGPPGTGKTYTAMELAKEMIVRHFMKKYKEAKRLADKNKQLLEKKEDAEKTLNKCFEILRNIGEEKKKYISYLQFHINYNYEDFIAGQVIEGNGIDTKKGFIFDVIEKAGKDNEIPYVVILDEINRTDISRVFGELFTAIEKRGEAVTLTFPKPKQEIDENKSKEKQPQEKNPLDEDRLTLSLPDNIYFIGTMNEIDFSLERVDFALRRRFIWELHDYSEDALEIIVNDRFRQYAYNQWLKFYKDSGTDEEKAKELALKEQSFIEDSNDGNEKKELKKKIRAFYGAATLSDFCNSCTILNKEVEKAMGEAYHIGHAFFAEIANLYIELTKNGISKPWGNAKKILWEISIKPTLDAYCGSMDKSEKEKYLKANEGDFYKAYFKLEELKDEESNVLMNSETEES